MARRFLFLVTACLVASMPDVRAYPSSIEDPADSLEEAADDLADKIESLVDDEDLAHWFGGEDGALSRNARVLKIATEDLHGYLDDEKPKEVIVQQMQFIGRKLATIRAVMPRISASAKAQEYLTKCETYYTAIRTGIVRGKLDKPEATAEPAQPKSAETSAPSAGYMETHAIGYGDRKITQANSAARRYVHRKYGVPHDRMETRQIVRRGEGLAVTIQATTATYILQVKPDCETIADVTVKGR